MSTVWVYACVDPVCLPGGLTNELEHLLLDVAAVDAQTAAADLQGWAKYQLRPRRTWYNVRANAEMVTQRRLLRRCQGERAAW